MDYYEVKNNSFYGESLTLQTSIRCIRRGSFVIFSTSSTNTNISKQTVNKKCENKRISLILKKFNIITRLIK